MGTAAPAACGLGGGSNLGTGFFGAAGGALPRSTGLVGRRTRSTIAVLGKNRCGRVERVVRTVRRAPPDGSGKGRREDCGKFPGRGAKLRFPLNSGVATVRTGVRDGVQGRLPLGRGSPIGQNRKNCIVALQRQVPRGRINRSSDAAPNRSYITKERCKRVSERAADNAIKVIPRHDTKTTKEGDARFDRLQGWSEGRRPAIEFDGRIVLRK